MDITATQQAVDPHDTRRRILAIVGASSGNLVEWFDFYVYAFCSLYFAPAFFPKGDPTTQLLNTAGVFAAGYLFRRWQNTPLGRRSWDGFTLRAPIFGELVRLIAVTRFARTMGTLLASGVPILGAMNIAKNLVGNVPIENAISSARENITEIELALDARHQLQPAVAQPLPAGHPDQDGRDKSARAVLGTTARNGPGHPH